MPFEKYIPESKSKKKPLARIRPSGLISFDGEAVENFDLEGTDFAILFFDKQRKILGIQPTKSGEDSGALKLSKRRNSMAVKAPEFFARYNLVIDAPKTFPVRRKADGMLVLDLSRVKRRRGRRPSSTAFFDVLKNCWTNGPATICATPRRSNSGRATIRRG